MLGLIQRVSYATVEVNGDRVGEIGRGILLLLGVQAGDNEVAATRLLHKVLNYRIFPDDEGRMNLNLQQMGGGLMVVSQFTLAADTSRGNRPGYSRAAPPDLARALYERFADAMRGLGVATETGQFGADMQVSLVNDGPVTIWIDG